MSTSPEGPPPSTYIQPAAENYALRDIKVKLRAALTDEWYRANQAGDASRDYSRRDLVTSHLEMVEKWQPPAPAGGIPRGGGAKKGRQVRPPAVERADLLMQMLTHFPKLDDLLERTGTVRDALKDARAAQERMSAPQSFSRWRNPFAKAAHLVYPGYEHLARRQPSASPVVPPGLRRTAPTTARRSVR
ncbi:hypothetical protein AB0368_38370 [Actinoplanes sp. NPDC051475]|uniref:hypothetical protein n=1 Tax=Actinoplanes sp. NPDC051475 TaxID=3157225 RepID=UPI00344C57FD